MNPASQSNPEATGELFQFSLRKMFALLTVACVLLALFSLLITALGNSRETARSNNCRSNLKMLGLSMHNHHDVHNRLPLASSQPRTGRPGSAQSPDLAGYSWHVAILPFIEELQLYDQFYRANPNFVRGAFEPSSNPEIGCTVIRILKCYSDPGDERVDNSQSEYQTYSTSQGKQSLARSTFVAFAASHFANEQGLADPFDPAGRNQFDGNGMFPFPTMPRYLHGGLSFKDVTDGTSRTLMLCETRETAYAAWLDGQATWVVGAWQGNSQVPSETGAADGLLGWPDEDRVSRMSLRLNSYPQSGNIYLSAARFGAGHHRQWGPSSVHEMGLVNHVFADNHVESISPWIDRNLYLRLISRAGGEPVNLD